MKVTLSAGVSGTGNSFSVSITVNPDPTINHPLPSGTVGVPYTATITPSGGTAPVTLAVTPESLPAGLTFNAATNVVSGTPTAAGITNFNVQITDASDIPYAATAAESITIATSATALSVSGNPPGGNVGAPYSATLTATGGTAPYTWSIISGSLPAGLALSPTTGIISGTPTTTGLSVFTAQAQDSTGAKASAVFSITISDAVTTLSITPGSLPNGVVGIPYSATIGVTGGTAPYNCVFTAGMLPAGLTQKGCVVSGTPTMAGLSNLTVQATDSGNPMQMASGPESITITNGQMQLMLTTGMLPNGTVGVPYSATIGVSGGTAPYSCVFTAGTLPLGLTLNGCVVSGTPAAAGTSSLTVKATDSSNPVETTSGPESITITAASSTLMLTTGMLPNGTVGVPYSATIGVSGGTAPYSCVFTAGTLPAGLALNGCIVSGTPTAAGTSNLTVKATDSSTPTQTVSGPESITINAAEAQLTLTMATLPDGTVNIPYSATIGISGGTAPYNCTITAGALPAGLTLSGCVVSGTPTTAGTSTVTVKATDSSNPAETVTGPETITINPAPVLIISSPPPATVNVPYSATIPVSGGKAPYSCVITAGTLPAGLTISGCVISGTPITAGTKTLTVKATDSNSPSTTTTGPVTLVVNPAGGGLTLGNPPPATVGSPYTGIIPVSGGTAPYTCTVTAGTLPAGLTINNCTLSGTPTAPGSTTITVKGTDSGNPPVTGTGPVVITVNPSALTLTMATLPNGTVGVAYNATIGVSGGTAPYSCTITSGTLPAGLALTSAGCVVSGTPTTAGTSNLIVKATDSSNPTNSVTGPEAITIVAAGNGITVGNPPPGTVGAPYNGPIPITGGNGPYTCVLKSGTLPSSLSLVGCVITGTPVTGGTTTITIGVTDSGNPPVTGGGPVTIVINPAATLTFTGTLPNGVVGVAYSATLAASGGVPPYTYAITAGALPAGLTMSTGGVVTGTPTTVGASSLTVTATDSEATPQTASLPLVVLITYATGVNDSELDGPYAFLFQGYDDAVAGVLAYQTATIGSFTASGAGVISAGELDANHQSSVAAGNTVATQTFLGTYQVNADSRGFITITTLNANGTTAQTYTYAIALKTPVAPATHSAQGSLIEFDNNQLQGTKGNGTLLAQTASSFSAGLSGSYVFGMEGDTPCLPSCTVGIVAGPAASVGEFTASGGVLSAGMSDLNIASTNLANESVTGTYAAADSNGRVQLSMTTSQTPSGVYPTDYAVYLVSANQAFVMSTDKHSAYVLLSGSAQLQTQTAFGNAAMTGPFIGYENSATSPGLVSATLQNVVNFSTATIFRGLATADGNCDITNVDQGGATALVTHLTGLGGSLTGLNNLLGTFTATGAVMCAVSTTGRGVLQYPQQTVLGLPVGTPPAPRVLYLSAPDRGYFLETGYAGLGNIEPQTGAPFSLATFDGTYIYDEAAASSVASINTSGYITADGKGHATSTTDANVGVGTINILELGVTGTTTYTTPDPTSGRFIFNGTDVIYAISPSRFVFVDTNPLTTSPSVTLLY